MSIFTNKSPTFLTNAQLVFHDRVESGSILTGNGSIESIYLNEDTPSLPSDIETIDCQGDFVCPGFVDLHIHGGAGHDTMEATAESWEAISTFHERGGTAQFALTTATAEWKDSLNVLELAASKPSLSGAQLTGIHLEGPFLSPEKPGAHKIELLHGPTADEIQQLLDYQEFLTQITIAPEIPGAMELIKAFAHTHVILSAGHTNADEPTLRKAMDAGITQVTHLFNCMSTAHKSGYLRQAGVLETALSDSSLGVEIIPDGFHITPTLLHMAWNAKPLSHIRLITDATAGAGLQTGEQFDLAEMKALVQEGHATTVDKKSLAGSTITMIDAVRYLVGEMGLPLHDVIQCATRKSSKYWHSANNSLMTVGTSSRLLRLTPELKVAKWH